MIFNASQEKMGGHISDLTPLIRVIYDSFYIESYCLCRHRQATIFQVKGGRILGTRFKINKNRYCIFKLPIKLHF